MVSLPAAILKRVSPQPSFGYAYSLRKDRLALASSGSARLGIDEKAMSATFVVTSETPDRVGDIVKADGIQLDNYRKNPVWFFGHQAIILPIGVCEDPDGKLAFKTEGDRAIATCFFSKKSKEAEQVFALVSEGILRATSIGFNPLEPPVERNFREDNPNSIQPGFIFPKIDLLEISVVGVPAQPEATLVRRHLEAGRIAGMAIGDRLRKSLEPLAAPLAAWSSGTTLPNASETQSETPVSKKWSNAGKGNGKGNTAKTALAESSGAAGGYTTPEAKPDDVPPPDGKPQGDYDHATTVKAIHAAMAAHRKGSDGADRDPHAAYYAPASKAIHHQHHKDAEPEHLEAVRGDLGSIDGAGDVSQGTEAPNPTGPGTGNQVVYHAGKEYAFDPATTAPEQKPEEPAKDFDAATMTDPAGDEPHTSDEKTTVPPEDEVKSHPRDLRLSFLVGQGQAIQAMLKYLPAKKRDALQECVSRKIPKLIDEGYEQDQASAIAYSMCGEKDMFADEEEPTDGPTGPGDDDEDEAETPAADADKKLAPFTAADDDDDGDEDAAMDDDADATPAAAGSEDDEDTEEPLSPAAASDDQTPVEAATADSIDQGGDDIGADGEPGSEDDLEAAADMDANEANTDQVPFRAACLQALMAWCEEKLPLMQDSLEGDQVADFLEQIQAHAQKLCQQLYPHLGGNEPEDHEEEQELTDAAMERYSQPPVRDFFSPIIKQLGEHGAATIDAVKAAACHLHKMAAYKAGSTMTRAHIKEHGKHARGLEAAHGALTGGQPTWDEEEDKDDAPTEGMSDEVMEMPEPDAEEDGDNSPPQGPQQKDEFAELLADAFGLTPEECMLAFQEGAREGKRELSRAYFHLTGQTL